VISISSADWDFSTNIVLISDVTMYQYCINLSSLREPCCDYLCTTFFWGRHSLLNNPFFTWICWSCLTHEQGWMWDSGKLFNLQGYSRSYPAQNKTKYFFVFKDLGKIGIWQNADICLRESLHFFDNCM